MPKANFWVTKDGEECFESVPHTVVGYHTSRLNVGVYYSEKVAYFLVVREPKRHLVVSHLS